jgi:DNA (cytosine-5)-methyltransferase 3A
MELMKKFIVVSLCDGISIGRCALEQLGYDVVYYRAEIKETANRVAMTQFPDSHNLGDVTKVSYKDGVLHSELGDYELDHVDMVILEVLAKISVGPCIRKIE